MSSRSTRVSDSEHKGTGSDTEPNPSLTPHLHPSPSSNDSHPTLPRTRPSEDFKLDKDTTKCRIKAQEKNRMDQESKAETAIEVRTPHEETEEENGNEKSSSPPDSKRVSSKKRKGENDLEVNAQTKKKSRKKPSPPKKKGDSRFDPVTLLGQRIGVYWPAEGEFFYGNIVEFANNTGEAKVHYDDGENAKVSLKTAVWMLMDVPGANPVTYRGSKRIEKDAYDTELDPLIEGNGYVVYRTCSGPAGYEIHTHYPGHSLENVRVKCHPSGRVAIEVGYPSEGELPQCLIVELPTRIAPRSAHAVYSSFGQLFVRVDAIPSRIPAS